jgi:ribosomal protein L7/L12
MANLAACICCAAQVSDEARVCPRCGQPDPTHDVPKWGREARRIAATGAKIEAIKLIREYANLSLKEAKDLVESWR